MQTQKSYKRLDIQGLRGFAVLLVLAFHADLPIDGGFIGVDIFFVISGFVISEVLRREFELKKCINFKEFYIKRFFRLVPNLGLMICTTLIISAIFMSPLGWQQNAQKTGVSSLFFVSNLLIPELSGGYFDLTAATNPFLHTWSLSVEEQFYLIFPAIIFFSWRNKNGVLKVFKSIDILLILTIVSLVFCLILSQQRGSDEWQVFNYYSSLTRMWEFGFGALAARYKTNPKVLKLTRLSMVKNICLIVLITSAFVINSETIYPGPLTLLPVLATSIFLLVGEQKESRFSKIHSNKLIIKIGDMSYSLYLWHWPFVVISTSIWPSISGIALFSTITSIVPSFFAYKFLEVRYRNSVNFSLKNVMNKVVLYILIPLFISIGTWVIASNYWQPKFSTILNSTQNFTKLNGDCHFDRDFENPKECRFNTSSGGLPIYLVGDSNAAHFGAGFEEISKSFNLPLVISTAASCPFIPKLVLTNRNIRDSYCEKYFNHVMNLLRNGDKGIVVVSFSDKYFSDSKYFLETSDNLYVNTMKEKLKVYSESLRQTLIEIQSFGHKIVFINPIPHFTDAYSWNPRTCLLSELLQGCEKSMPLIHSMNIQKDFKEVTRTVTALLEISSVDLSDKICTNGICINKKSGGWIYSDSTHITNSFSRQLSDVLVALVL